MNSTIPKTMKAVVIDKFGGPEVLHVATIPVPELGEREVLIHVDTAGIGVWDPWLREQGMGGESFPLVLGSDGSGTIVACGSKVKRFKAGDRVYGFAFGSPKGGFYAEHAVISEEAVAPIPVNISIQEAGVLMASGLTALAGLEKLNVGEECALMILGASGGVGHVALQLAKRLGARLLAVASRKDGVELATRLGADRAVNGHSHDLEEAVKAFAPEGLDAALAFASSENLMGTLKKVKKGGGIAYPNGVEPVPKGPAGVNVQAFDGTPSANAFKRLNDLIARGSFHVEISRAYKLEEAAQAHRDILKHHIGKLAFRIQD